MAKRVLISLVRKHKTVSLPVILEPPRQWARAPAAVGNPLFTRLIQPDFGRDTHCAEALCWEGAGHSGRQRRGAANRLATRALIAAAATRCQGSSSSFWSLWVRPEHVPGGGDLPLLPCGERWVTTLVELSCKTVHALAHRLTSERARMFPLGF
uniref:Uncharacterized protein n=1 Tax=Peronospora matthiolae TaxID=2874970 RepID=A0AAV1UNX9_9STRA